MKLYQKNSINIENKIINSLSYKEEIIKKSDMNINDSIYIKTIPKFKMTSKSKQNINDLKIIKQSRMYYKKSVNNFNSLKKQNFDSLKDHRRKINQKKRKKLIKESKILKLFWNCTSKIQLMHIFKIMSKKWKEFLRYYLGPSFIFHLAIRQLKNVSELMSHRQNLFDSLNEPELLITKINFTNNLIKNFCKGVANFVIMFYEDLVKQKMIV